MYPSSIGDGFLQIRKKKNAQRQAHISPNSDILNRVSSPQPSFLNSQSFIQTTGASLENSPLFIPSSLPANPNRSQAIPISEKHPDPTSQQYIFNNYSSSFQSKVYPSVVVNGVISDVNQIVAEIVKNSPASTMQNRAGQVSYVCPVGHVPITCPGRGASCSHAQCFDLREFLIMQSDDNWKCPICGAPIDISSLRFDPFFFTSAPDTPEPQANLGAQWGDIAQVDQAGLDFAQF